MSLMALFNDPLKGHIEGSPVGSENGQPVLLLGVDFAAHKWLVVDSDGNPTMVDLALVVVDWRWVEDRPVARGPGWADLDELLEATAQPSPDESAT